jgi:YidC/Oxa1 family membrane protein insertase
VNTLSPAVQKAFMYGLPVISLIFTAFLPSAVQLWFALNSVLGFFQAGLFRMAGFRAWAGMTPLPENARLVVDAAAAAPKSSPVQERVVVIEKGRQYRDKDSSSVSYQPPRKVTKEDKTILGGFKREVTGTIDSIKGSMKDTIKQGREMMKSQEGADGKRTKAQLAEANKYEEKRRAEEARRIAEMDERRKEARIQKRRRKSEA